MKKNVDYIEYIYENSRRRFSEQTKEAERLEAIRQLEEEKQAEEITTT